jgi:hypothetical protein
VTAPDDSPSDGRVMLDVWQVRPRDIAQTAVTGSRAVRRLRNHPDVSFAKFLGTAGPSFQPWRATPRRWALFTCWRHTTRSPDVVRRSTERATLQLRPLWSRGSWDGDPLFDVARSRRTVDWPGAILMLTRSTLRATRAARFYRTVPAIAADIQSADGLRVAFGIGEAPLLRQGTVSIWSSLEAMTTFARNSSAHSAAVRATESIGWYDEELFAGFAIEAADGCIEGVRL